MELYEDFGTKLTVIDIINISNLTTNITICIAISIFITTIITR